MPSHKVHIENTRRRLGQKGNGYPYIHKLVDNPYLVPALRARHRLIFHDPITPFLFANILAHSRKDPKGEGMDVILAVISHLIDDYGLVS
ncbi:MAG: hypothetical protein QXI43_00005 [Candidatus Nitrosocaldus sp.]